MARGRVPPGHIRWDRAPFCGLVCWSWHLCLDEGCVRVHAPLPPSRAHLRPPPSPVTQASLYPMTRWCGRVTSLWTPPRSGLVGMALPIQLSTMVEPVSSRLVVGAMHELYRLCSRAAWCASTRWTASLRHTCCDCSLSTLRRSRVVVFSPGLLIAVHSHAGGPDAVQSSAGVPWAHAGAVGGAKGSCSATVPSLLAHQHRAADWGDTRRTPATRETAV